MYRYKTLIAPIEMLAEALNKLSEAGWQPTDKHFYFSAPDVMQVAVVLRRFETLDVVTARA
jgi:hypothetical protein